MRDEACAAKAGSVMLDFLQRLVGSKAKDMKLQGDVVEIVKFNPKELLATLGQTVTALGNCPAASAECKAAFLDAMCVEQEALKVLQKTYKNLGKCGVGSGTLEGVAMLAAAVSTKVSASAASAAAASVDGGAEESDEIVLFNIDDATVDRCVFLYRFMLFYIVSCCFSIVLCCFSIVLCCFISFHAVFLSFCAVFLSFYAVFVLKMMPFARYAQALGDMCMRDADMGCGGDEDGDGGVATIAHYYGSEIEASPMDARTGRVKMRALGKNIKAFREMGEDGKGALPCRPEASAFMLSDTTRMDVFKFMLSGPTETPYSFGLFEFHVSNTATHGVIKAGSERRLCV